MSWSRLIRFEDEDGSGYFGEPDIENAEQLSTFLEENQLYAFELSGSSPFDLSAERGARKRVKALRGILEPNNVPLIKCVGLNYMKHSS